MSTSSEDTSGQINLAEDLETDDVSIRKALWLPKVRKWEASIPMHREGARRQIALSLLFIFLGEIFLPMLLVAATLTDWQTAKEFMQISIPPTLGLLGSAMGFYFGSQTPNEY